MCAFDCVSVAHSAAPLQGTPARTDGVGVMAASKSTHLFVTPRFSQGVRPMVADPSGPAGTLAAAAAKPVPLVEVRALVCLFLLTIARIAEQEQRRRRWRWLRDQSDSAGAPVL